MLARIILVAFAIVGIGAFSIVAFDVTVLKNDWHITRAGNVECNKSFFASKCRMLDDEKLWGMYKGLMRVQKDK